MGKKYIIFLCLLMLGCSQSETPLPLNNQNNHTGDNHSNNPEFKYDLNGARNISPPSKDFSLNTFGLNKSGFNKSGLTRIIDHLKFSNLANDRAEVLSSFAIALRMAYDWKTEPPEHKEETKSYLKGGKEDLIGKLLEILTLKYNRYEARNALIEIIEKDDLLMETIQYFTSEPILSAQKLTDLHHAIEEKNVSDIKELLDDIYVNFYHFFGKHYHLKSVWEEVKENGKTIFQPKESGFEKTILTFRIGDITVPVDYEPLLNDLAGIDIEKNETGNFRVKKTLKRAVIREFIVDLLTSFVTRYYEIEDL